MIRTRKPPPPLESAIQRTCIALLRSRGVLCWRNNTGSFAGEYKGKRRFMRFGTKGASDILGVLDDGRMLAVEIKREGQKPSAGQVAFMAIVNSKGGVGFWVDNARYLELVLDHVLKGASVEADEMGVTIVPKPRWREE